MIFFFCDYLLKFGAETNFPLFFACATEHAFVWELCRVCLNPVIAIQADEKLTCQTDK